MEIQTYQTYRAVIREPNKALPEPDKYGTLTIPGAWQTFGPSPVPLRMWARKLLQGCAPGSFCEIYRMEEALVERVDQVAQECSDKS